MTKLTDFHRANLLKLADYLDTVEPSSFDMSEYRICTDDENDVDTLSPSDPEPECGTVCCAAGSGLLAGIPAIPSDHYWENYTLRVFGVDVLGQGADWSWLFHYSWEETDNTPKGAARRIRYFLEHGVPADWEDQMVGSAPYMFEEYIGA